MQLDDEYAGRLNVSRLIRQAGPLLTGLPPILVAALILRVGFAWNYQHGKPEHALGAISFLYEPGNIAYSLVTHHGFSSPFRSNTGPTAWMTPVYPLLLAAIFRVFGTYTYSAFLAAVGFNIICSALTTIPLFKLGQRLGGASVAASAAWLWAVFPNAIIIPTRDLWDASLTALLAALILWATIRIELSSRLAAWAAYGALWGLALMTNPTLGSVLPLPLAWMAFRGEGTPKARVSRLSLVLTVIVLACVPWTVRNYVVFHSFIPLRSVMGLQLWMGNNEQSGTRWPGQLHPLSNSQERELYSELGEIAYMKVKESEALRFIASHPKKVLQLSGRRFIATWTGGTETPVTDFMSNRSFWFRLILVANIIAAIGAFAGVLILFARRDRFAVPVSAFPLIYPLVAYFTLASPRYRHPVDPIILLLTAVALVQIRKRAITLP